MSCKSGLSAYCQVYFVHFSWLLTSCVVISVCHSACDTCIGEGSQGCIKCNTGYKMADNECKGKARAKILLLLILGFKGSIHPEKLPVSWFKAWWPHSQYTHLWIKWSRLELATRDIVLCWARHLTLLLQCLSPPRCMNRYWQI